MAGQRFTGRYATFTSFVAVLLTLFVLALALTPRAEAFVYWTNTFGGKIGRANLDGTGVDKSFITGGGYPYGVAVDAGHIYWTNRPNLPVDVPFTMGRANLDGTGVDPEFIAGGGDFFGVAVDLAHVYWGSSGVIGRDSFYSSIGRANLDGSDANPSFIRGPYGWGVSGVAVDDAHIYWTNRPVGGEPTIGRANLDGTGVDPSFIPAREPFGVAVDAEHIYWTNRPESDFATIGRANLDGTGVDQSFIAESAVDCAVGIAVDRKHVYWASPGFIGCFRTTIGRANLDGTGADLNFIADPGSDAQTVAVDALRSFSFGNVKRNTKRGTAMLTAKVPGPGSLKLARTENVKGPRTFADVKGKTKLPVRSRGKAKKELNRRGKAKVEAEVSYTPRGGEPNIVASTLTKTVKLRKR